LNLRQRLSIPAAVLALALVVLSFAAGSPAADTGKLVVRVVDAETGRTLPARLSLRTSDGKYPGDRLDLSGDRWPNIEAHAVFISGEQTLDVTPGKTELIAAHGLDYRAEAQTVEVAAGKTQPVELKLRRVFNMRKAGWVAGDMHVHMLHGENQRRTGYQDVATTCAAQGLDFVAVGQEYVGAGQLDLAGYEAECRKVSTDQFTMLLGAERPKNLLGHQVLLGVRNPFLISEDPPYYRSARKVHAQGGVLAYVHPIRYFPGREYQGKWLDFPGNNLARELVFDALLGPSFDALSVLSDEPAHPTAHGLWFTLLNRGLFVPALADSDACFDRPTLGMKAPGFWNTYFHVGLNGKVDQESVAAAVRRGQTLATTGPLLQFEIDKQISGATLAPDGTSRTVRIDAWLPQHSFSLQSVNSRSGKTEGIARIELIRNGEVVKTWEPHSPEAHVTHTITETEKCWYVARVFGEDAKWQVGVASPIYFGTTPAVGKREPLVSDVSGRIYDFKTGEDRTGVVEIRRDDQVLQRLEASGPFQIRMPLDADIVVTADGFRPQRRNLLLDYGPVHRFLWYLQSGDLARPETFEQLEQLGKSIKLEFPLGYRMPGSYFASNAAEGFDWQSLRVADGPPRVTNGTASVAAILMDTEQVSVGDTIQLAAIYRDEGDPSKLGPLVIEARGYDARRPTAYGALKKFAEFEKRWDTAVDLGNGYRLVHGSLKVADWVEPGPTGGVDVSVRARQGNGDASFVGLHVPLGPTRRALSLTTPWPTMPLSWPDGRYGIGPFTVCSRAGREQLPRSDYRKLRLTLNVAGKALSLSPTEDTRGCPDSEDAVYTNHYFDQVLSEVTGVGK